MDAFPPQVTQDEVLCLYNSVCYPSTTLHIKAGLRGIKKEDVVTTLVPTL